MPHTNARVAGLLFFIASAGLIVGLVVAEALYPSYSLSRNYISDLGVGPSAATFNTSVFLFGLLSLIGAYMLPRTTNSRGTVLLLGLMAIGTMGVGIVTSAASTTIHGAAALAAFGFSGLAALTSCRMLKLPLSAISVALGLMTLVALTLFAAGLVTTGALTTSTRPVSGYFLGLGPGGMERLIVYPALVWLLLFSGRLMALAENSERLA